jgi:S-adenosylmethionine:tRNA-ribosyltransferase-isomerase (queuine synthetase)
MLRNLGPNQGAPLAIEGLPDLRATVVETIGEGEYELAMDSDGIPTPAPAAELLERVGRMPLPP